MRGAWESIVKLTKRALRIVTDDRKVSQEVLITFLTKIKAISNTWPLTSLIP